MEYIYIFIEGILTFISPCILPVFPILISYLVGENSNNSKKMIKNVISFVLGFTTMFIILGIFANILSRFFLKYIDIINIVFSIIIIIFGLHFAKIFEIKILNRTKKIDTTKISRIASISPIFSYIFGIIFSLGWSPCVGPFLASAIYIASVQQNIIKGITLLLTYSLGLGIPFILGSMFLSFVKRMFLIIQENYDIFSMISGIVLISFGILKLFKIF